MNVRNQTPSPQEDAMLHETISRRFPRYGTTEFAEQCNWTIMDPVKKQHDCTILSRPPAQQHEGLAEWVSMAVSRFIVAKLQGCQLLLDYGPSVDLHQVLVPHDNKFNNWTIPTGFTECTLRNKCSTAGFKSQSRESHDKSSSPGRQTSPIPIYRHAFTGVVQHNMYRKTFQHLALLPGFDLETGMACAFESLFQLSPAALQFQPELFTDILPKLRDPHSLVLALYIRTNHADAAASAEKRGEVVAVETTNEVILKKRATLYLPCVLDVEQQYMSSSSSSSSYSHVVWMVVSDSPVLKEWIAKEYTVPNVVNADVGLADGVENDVPIPREVITTKSRGVHTRAARKPSTSDFAEGMIDWYLLGESDAVITNGLGFSFGTTGALRTNRPLYNFDYAARGGSCTRKMLVHEEDPPMSEQLHFVVR